MSEESMVEVIVNWEVTKDWKLLHFSLDKNPNLNECMSSNTFSSNSNTFYFNWTDLTNTNDGYIINYET